MKYSEIEDLLTQDESTIYVMLGKETGTQILGARPSKDTHEKIGKSWWLDRRNELAEALCGQNVVQLYLKSKKADDRVVLVAAIADLISSIVSGVAAITVAVLIVREGLDTLCHERNQ